MSTASQIKALQQQVKILNAQVAGLRKSKADNVDLATVASGVLSNTSNIQLLTQAAAGLQASLGSLQTSMTGLATAIGLKADASGLDLKADKTALNDLVQKVMQLQANH
jgi:prefoldin subunit 5